MKMLVYEHGRRRQSNSERQEKISKRKKTHPLASLPKNVIFIETWGHHLQGKRVFGEIFGSHGKEMKGRHSER